MKSYAGNLKMHLNEGWNRLLVKAICDKAQMPYGCAGNFPKDELGHVMWRFAAYIGVQGVARITPADMKLRTSPG